MTTKHERERLKRDLKRKKPFKSPYQRMLIVCEGEKTEPKYFQAIRLKLRLRQADIRIIPSRGGTEPMQIIDFAVAEFKRIRDFDHIYVVFDRDAHLTYRQAVEAGPKNDRTMRNNDGDRVEFTCVPSVPNFELWILLHFEEVRTFAHRQDIVDKVGRYIPGYGKGMDGVFERIEGRVADAVGRAERLRENFGPLPGADPYTQVDQLVSKLLSLSA